MEIRRATATDAAAMSDRVSELARRHLRDDCTEPGFDRLLAEMTTQAFEKRMSEGYVYWLALDDGRLAGVCGVRLPSHLYHLFVGDAFQRKGVASKLLETAVEYCRSADPSLEAMTVNASKVGLPAYRRLGFVEEGAPLVRNGVTSQPMRLLLRDSSGN